MNITENLLGRLKYLLTVGMTLLALHLSLSADLPADFKVDVIGGAHRLFRLGIDRPELEITAWSNDGVPHDLDFGFQIQDLFERPATATLPSVIFHVSADGHKTRTAIPLNLGIGYYTIVACCDGESSCLTRDTDLGIVWPPYAGTRPNSFFASNVPPQDGDDRQLLETIGVKVQRTHFVPEVAIKSRRWPSEAPAGTAVPLLFDRLDQQWKAMQDHGLWVLPIVGYSLAGSAVFDRTPLAEKLQMYGPPNDEKRFIRTWETVLRHYPEITTYEFWNEPWIFGWTWAATAEDYRRFQKDWCSMALGVNPHYRLLAGNSTSFVRDIIEPHPDCWEGLLQGVTHHPYTQSILQPSLRGGDLFRSVDEIRLTAGDLGLPYAYLTEGGTAFRHSQSTDDNEPFNNLENAEKLVQYYVSAALAGVYMGNAQWEIGYGPGWTRSNTAFAVMTHSLEDRVPLVDIWPRQPLLWGAIFANRKFATPTIKALPRASELSARYDVEVPPGRGNDETKVAVIWALTGPDANHLDKNGQLVIQNAADLKAFDLGGQEIPASNGQLVLPLSPAPVYVTTDRLSVLELRDRVRLGVIRHVTPINFYAFSLTKPAAQKQKLTVRIQNQINRDLAGTLVLHAPDIDETSSARFEIPAGELVEVEVAWPGLPVSPDNRYPIRLIAQLDSDDSEFAGGFEPASKNQIISVAAFQKRAIELTGNLSDWDNLVPVSIDSNWFEQPADQTAALLNPTVKPGETNIGQEHVTAKIFTAYDDDNVYMGAAVNQAHFHCAAGELITRTVGKSTVTLPYRQTVPNELDFPTEDGDDLLQFSFGFRDRVPGIGRQMEDPWAWKGAFYDTDYSFFAHTSTDGDKLIRIWGPDTSRRNGYQTEAVPGIGPVEGALVKITRDEAKKLTLYEIAIPRRQLALFDPTTGRCRFGFILYTSKEIAGGALPWSDVAGVFDYWQSNGSFPPTWKFHTACQTFFGIERQGEKSD
jgi:hypothetical protein